MRFLADMGVDVRVVEWLRQQAHDAKHLRDEGLERSPDSEIFAEAVNESRVVLTFDLDFGAVVSCNDQPGNLVPRPSGPFNVSTRWPAGGDYFGLTAHPDGSFRALWSDSRTGVFQLWTTRIAVVTDGGGEL